MKRAHDELQIGAWCVEFGLLVYRLQVDKISGLKFSTEILVFSLELKVWFLGFDLNF